MPFEILSCEGQDASRWTDAVAGLPSERRDIHLLPEYGRIFGECYGFRPCLAVYRGEAGHVLQPFVRRPLGGLPFLAGKADIGRYSDIANAYGYGGALCSVGQDEEARALYVLFARAFAGWCEGEGIASEFCSLHPLLAAHQRHLIGGSLPVEYVKDVVVIDLGPDEAEILKGVRKGHRSSIALARRSGVRVERVEPTEGNVAKFKAVYEITMDRREAAERWYVPDGFFALTLSSLGNARASLLFAYVGDELESGCLLMHDFATAYYHFAGTYANHPALGVNNLLVWEAAMFAKRAGYLRFHLGGGVTARPEDTLLRFKAGFTNGRAPLHTYFAVRNQAVYDDLCAQKIEYERAHGGELKSGFLPLYRR